MSEKIYSAKELLSIKFPKVVIHNQDFLPLRRGVLTMISGAGGVGKGFVSLQSAIRFLKYNQQAKALLWFFEDPKEIIRERIELFDVSDVEDRLYFTQRNPHTFDDWKKHIGEFDFVVIDPLVYFYPDDENDNGEAGKFINELRDSTETNKNITIIIHHHSKTGTTRGASAFTDGSRLVYQLLLPTEKDDTDELPDKAVFVNVLKDNYQVCKKEISYIVPQKMEDAQTVEETF